MLWASSWGDTMRTIGTDKNRLREMTDTQLRAVVLECSLDVARAANNPSSTDFEIQFAIGTLNRVGREVRLRAVSSRSASELSGIVAP